MTPTLATRTLVHVWPAGLQQEDQQRVGAIERAAARLIFEHLGSGLECVLPRIGELLVRPSQVVGGLAADPRRAGRCGDGHAGRERVEEPLTCPLAGRPDHALRSLRVPGLYGYGEGAPRGA